MVPGGAPGSAGLAAPVHAAAASAAATALVLVNNVVRGVLVVQAVESDATLAATLDIVAQVEFESLVGNGSSYFSFKRSVSGAFNVGLIGSTCIALP